MERKNKSSLSITLIIIVVCFFAFPDFCKASDKAAKIDELMTLYHDAGLFNGALLVAEAGQVIYRKGFGLANMEWNIPNRVNTKFRIGSVTKQFTAMLILQLVEQGEIQFEEKISDYFPEFRKDIGERVTIHHLLTHTSGISNYASSADFVRKEIRNPCTVDEFIQKFCNGDPEFEPGARFSYNNGGYFILGAIIEKVTGKKYEEVLKEKIFDPLGMKDTGYDYHHTVIQNRAAGYVKTLEGYRNAPYVDMSLPYAAGSIYSTVEDLYLWDTALYTDKLLSNEMMEMFFKPHVSAMGQKYAYGWFIGEKRIPGTKDTSTVVSHSGGIFGFMAWVERWIDLKHTVILLNNTGGVMVDSMSSGIINVLYDKPFTLPKKSIAESLMKTILEKDVKEAIELYKNLKSKQKKDYIFIPRELNALGYYLLRSKNMVKEAIEIFKLNVEEYPKYANGYDSLAEAYMINGDESLAITNYAKSLQLNPRNTNAIKKLSELIK
ncbi:MAG: serine hydrolase [Candidatus Aminicenantes bacterium]|nr:MAG: serine hydrolase [Candidatus Aminicenantes bacterium]